MRDFLRLFFSPSAPVAAVFLLAVFFAALGLSAVDLAGALTAVEAGFLDAGGLEAASDLAIIAVSQPARRARRRAEQTHGPLQKC